jgi:hypothetical protein
MVHHNLQTQDSVQITVPVKAVTMRSSLLPLLALNALLICLSEPACGEPLRTIVTPTADAQQAVCTDSVPCTHIHPGPDV